jgi:predicted PurR-regulated permease PerM
MASRRDVPEISEYEQLPLLGGARPDGAVERSSGWDAATKRTVLVILLAVAALLLWISRGVLPLLIVALMISYLLNPLVDLAARVRIPRSITTIALFALVLVGLVLLPVLLVPVLITQLRDLGAFNVTATAFSLVDWVTRWINDLPAVVTVLGFEIPTDNLVAQFETGFTQITFVPTVAEVLSSVQQAIGTATGLISSTAALSMAVVGGIFQALITGIFIFFISLYLTKDLPSVRQYIESLFPQSYQPELREAFERIGYIWSRFFRGQLALCIVIGVVTWVVLRLIGMPGALILAIVAGLLEVIPNIGPIIAAIPAIVVALIQGSDVLGAYGIGNVGFALITVGAYFLIQQAENNLLVPRIIGDSVNLHPVVVMIGVAVGLNVFGILGALLAAPALASARVIGGYLHAKLLDYPPFAGKPPPKRRSARPRTYRKQVTGEELQLAEPPGAAPAAPGATVAGSAGTVGALPPPHTLADVGLGEAVDAEAQQRREAQDKTN